MHVPAYPAVECGIQEAESRGVLWALVKTFIELAGAVASLAIPGMESIESIFGEDRALNTLVSVAMQVVKMRVRHVRETISTERKMRSSGNVSRCGTGRIHFSVGERMSGSSAYKLIGT